MQAHTDICMDVQRRIRGWKEKTFIKNACWLCMKIPLEKQHTKRPFSRITSRTDSSAFIPASFNIPWKIPVPATNMSTNTTITALLVIRYNYG